MNFPYNKCQIENHVEKCSSENKLSTILRKHLYDNELPVEHSQLNDQILIPKISKEAYSNNEVTNYKFGKIVFNDSQQNHVGTKIVAKNLTIINPRNDEIIKNNSDFVQDQNNNIKVPFLKRLFTRRIKLILISVILVTFLIAIVLVAYFFAKPENKASTKPAPPSASTTMTSITTTGTTTEIWPTDGPVSDWFYSYSKWFGQEPLPRCPDPFYNESAKSTLVVDSLDSQACYNRDSCISILLQTKEDDNNMFKYNYVIGGDGRVYEEWGNNCFPKKEWDSDVIIKVAFIGDYHHNSNNTRLNDLEKKAFNKLLNEILLPKRQIKNYFTIYPQCCKSITTPGPGRLIIDFLNGELKPYYKPCSNSVLVCN